MRVVYMQKKLYLILFIFCLSFFVVRGVEAADGDLDTSFTGAVESVFAGVDATATQSDGKIIIVGSFSEYGGVSINNIARLNTDGTLDTSFDVGMGADNTLAEVVVQ